MSTNNVTDTNYLDSYIKYMCQINKNGISKFYDVIYEIIDDNDDLIESSLPNFSDYIEEEVDQQWVDKCLKNSFQNPNDKFMSNNSFLENNFNKLTKFNAEWEPQVVVEGTKLKGNVEDMRDIFDAICSAMKNQKD